jgi:hypothetical protein
VLLIALVVMSACSGSSAPTATVTTQVSVPAPPSPAPLASPSPAPSPSVAPGAAPGDVDGDGQADTVTVTATKLTVDLSGGGSVAAPIVESDVPKPVVSGLQDLDRDGHAEVWVETARGASTSFVQAFRYDGTKLSELTFAGGHIRFGIGGSVTHGDGFSCTPDGHLVVSTAESDNGTSYRIRTRSFRVSGASFVLLSDRTATAPSMDDPRVRAAYQVDCGSVGESG